MKGLLEQIRENGVYEYKPLTLEDLKDFEKLLEEQSSKPQKTSIMLTYGDIIAFHEAGILRGILEWYDEVMLGSKSLEFLREHGYE